MVEQNRLVAVILEVSDLERSARLYRDGFGLDLHVGADNEAGEDRWIGGNHVATSWTEGAYLHFALYQAKNSEQTTSAQVGLLVDDIQAAHERAVAAGAVVVHDPRMEPWGMTSRYRDFDGNVVALTRSA